MVQIIVSCPSHWKIGCYPPPCPVQTPVQPPKPQPVAQPVPPKDQGPYSVVYLVDEHNITKDVNLKPTRNGPTLQRRWAWHHEAVNLDNFNANEKPNTIQLHEKIANPKANPAFKWEGFMFDIPGGQAALRVSIVANADQISDSILSGPGGAKETTIDRVVGFAGVYPDSAIPLGPVVQVRRDDSYRCLYRDVSLNGRTDKVAWYCAYYITRVTPKKPTGLNLDPFLRGLVADGAGPDEPAATDDVAPVAEGAAVTDGGTAEKITNYDQLLDQNLDDSIVIGEDSWGGQVFGFTIDEKVEDSKPEERLEIYDGKAFDVIEESYKAAEAGEQAQG